MAACQEDYRSRSLALGPARVDVRARFLDSHDIIFIFKPWCQLSNEMFSPLTPLFVKELLTVRKKTTAALFVFFLLPVPAHAESSGQHGVNTRYFWERAGHDLIL